MRKKSVFTGVFLLCSMWHFSQQTIKGIILDNTSNSPLTNVSVTLKNTVLIAKTDNKGEFQISLLKKGNFILELNLVGYEIQNLPITLTNKNINLGTILLYKDITSSEDLSVISITDDALDANINTSDNIVGLLQASRDVFLNTAAFQFSASFFRVRGLDANNGKVLLNGVEMNKLHNGRAQWSNWGGLNDVLRNQEFSNGLGVSNVTFGGVLGTTNTTTRASLQRPGSRISYSSSNRSYVHRVMATHHTGVLKNGLSYSFSVSRRAGKEGFNEATSYNSNSFFMAVEKRINKKHHINFTGIYTPNRRGKSSPNTQEVINLKGIKYNEYWGFLNNRKINTRIKEVAEPILMLSHYWSFKKNATLQTNVSYQFGKVANSRLDFNAGANPSPTYYQNLPSYFLRNNNLAKAYTARNNFENDGQIDWHQIFDANKTNAAVNKNNAYVLYDDRNDDKQLVVNTIYTHNVNNHITINAKLAYKKLQSENFAQVINLLGGNGYLDINNFAKSYTQQQNDVLNPNRIVTENDKFRYHYTINAEVANAFLQAQFKYRKIDFYIATNASKTSYIRQGLYKNGRFENNSFGNSKKLNFNNFSGKTGATYKINGRHLIDFNFGYISQAPSIRNSFSNARENNNTVNNLQSEKILSTDISYLVRSPFVTARVTAYFANIKEATEISFYFADGVGGDNTAFVQEILSGIQKKNIGLEIGVEAQVTSAIKIKAAGAIGSFTYANNPDLYLTSDKINEGIFDKNGQSKNYTSYLKNYKQAVGPQNAYAIGFEYRDPNYWWIATSANFFSNTFIDVAPLTRSSNFYTAEDGLTFNDYNITTAQKLLQQERFKSYKVINLVGGKSWKINQYYISLFATVNNLFNTIYKSGGFEQGRNANYTELRKDKALEKPVFGNKYWFGRGTTYFLNANIGF
ncbi:TonB-dependent receptor [Polaribacter tangerinus]|uniref:TonB-dependent receptor n=1 Tax=Polaribacter tangerinus TaxID=1920034 RepID=UPI000B4B043C|nr:TonB-dependent receptor [Polaribacter tangerinus]